MLTLIKKYWLVAVIVLLLAVIAGLVMWILYYRPEPKPQVQYTQAQTNPGVEKIEREPLQNVTVQVIPKDKLAKKIDTMPAILNNPSVHPAAFGVVPAGEGDTNVIPVYNEDTGSITIETQRKPRDWFEFKNEWFVGGGYNMLDTTNPWRVDAGWTPLRTGCMEWSAEAMLTNAYQFAGIMGRCRF